MREQRRRTRVAAAWAGLLAAFALVLAGGPALAHDELLGQSPEAGSHVDVLPDEIVLTFSGVLLDEPGATEVTVVDVTGTDLAESSPVLDGTRVTQALDGAASGPVVVTWRVVSSDGHPISGTYDFQVGDEAVAPADTETPLPGPPMAAMDMTWIWIVLGIVVIGLGGAFVAILMAKARGRREH